MSRSVLKQQRSHLRIAARLDVKAPNVVKGVQLEGLRVVGRPQDLAQRYFEAGIDEIVYQDVVASLYGRNSILELVAETARSTFVPLTVGGGLRSVDDVRQALVHGADRVSGNTGFFENPGLVQELAETFGSQCVSVTIECRRNGSNRWECLTSSGRERTGVEVREWVGICSLMGAGEIALTSVDFDGTRKGFDLELLATVTEAVDLPVTIHGGFRSADDALAAWEFGAAGIVIASAFHYGDLTVTELKTELSSRGIPVRS